MSRTHTCATIEQLSCVRSRGAAAKQSTNHNARLAHMCRCTSTVCQYWQTESTTSCCSGGQNHSSTTRAGRGRIECLIFKGLIPRKSPVIIGRCAEQDLQDKKSYGSFPTRAEREKERERESNGWVLRGAFSSCSRGLTHAALPANHPPPE